MLERLSSVAAQLRHSRIGTRKKIVKLDKTPITLAAVGPVIEDDMTG